MRAAFSYGPQKTVQSASPVKEWSVPYTLGSSSAMSRPDLFAAGEVVDENIESTDLTGKHSLEQALEEARAQWRTVISSMPVSTVPEAFSLSPLSRRRVCVRIRKVDPAPFQFVVDDDVRFEAED